MKNKAITLFLIGSLVISSTVNATVLFENDAQHYKDCTEYAEIIEEIMTGECGGDSDIFNMAYSYCKENKFQNPETN